MSTSYLGLKEVKDFPRLPLEGLLDLTYHCNNDCQHCWVKIPPNAKEINQELTFLEIRKIVDDARKMGCRRWSISGGEPMLRSDFPEIFDYITRNSLSYSLNTNGTLITPKISALMKRKGAKMIVLYGATAKVHDQITRTPGSFEATMQGFAYLKEAGAGFTVQLIPMKDNYHQFNDMVKLAKSLSKHYRVGAPWLYLSACGDKKINARIKRQRLPAKEVVELDKPDLSYEELMAKQESNCHQSIDSEYLFASCIKTRRDFHIDPYGKMTFCSFIKDAKLRYNLRKGSFRECWEEFIPSLSQKIKISREYKENCGSCELRKDCRICPVYAYLEHRDYNKKVEYLCAVARENRRFKDNWLKVHRRYFKIADITIQVESDSPITEHTFHPKFKLFEVDGPGDDTISIRHHFSLPDLNGKNLGKLVYQKPPWAIYKKNGSWIYLGIPHPLARDKSLHQIAVFNHNFTRAMIYNRNEEDFLKGQLHSLTLLPTDQVLLARVLADRQGCYLHSCGVNFQGKGLLFVGHSEAGKSTMARILKAKAKILCDDRMIVRKPNTQHPTPNSEFRIYGTWSNGDVAEVSSDSAPLKAIFFLNKASENRFVLLKDRSQINQRLLACLVKPLTTVEWWEKMLQLTEKIVEEIPCYLLYFDQSGEVVDLLKKL